MPDENANLPAAYWYTDRNRVADRLNCPDCRAFFRAAFDDGNLHGLRLIVDAAGNLHAHNRAKRDAHTVPNARRNRPDRM